MSPAPLITDAETALETIRFAAGRDDCRQRAIAAAEWLERIARELRDGLASEPV